MRRALEMNPDERRQRMGRMRRYVREHNVYRWAGTLIGDLADIRPGAAPHRQEPALMGWTRTSGRAS
jgi:trehalose 6-phosphate synthase